MAGRICSTTTTAVSTAMKGFRLQRHVDSVHTAPFHFHPDRVQRIKLPNAITLEYAIHEHQPDVDAASSSNLKSEKEEEHVVLVMGFVHTKEVWTPTIDTILQLWQDMEPQRTLKILTMDNRGVGGSTSPLGPYSTQMLAGDVLALMDHVGWKTAHVVGFSMGGMISLELAHMAPARVQSLTLLVTTRGRYFPDIKSVAPLVRTLEMKDQATEIHNQLMILYPAPFLSQEMENDGRKTMYEVIFDCHKYLSDALAAPRVFGVIGQSTAVLSHYVSDERLREIRDFGFPITVIGAGQDVIIPARESRTLQNVLAADHVRAVMYEDAGHGAFIQYLDEVAMDIIGTVRRGIA